MIRILHSVSNMDRAGIETMLMNYAMKEKASNLGIKDRVTFVGNVGNANEWYQAFDCFVLPSVWEGLPVVGVEAQAADLPCIFSSAVTDWFVRSCKIHPAYRRNLDLGN